MYRICTGCNLSQIFFTVRIVSHLCWTIINRKCWHLELPKDNKQLNLPSNQKLNFQLTSNISNLKKLKLFFRNFFIALLNFRPLCLVPAAIGFPTCWRLRAWAARPGRWSSAATSSGCRRHAPSKSAQTWPSSPGPGPGITKQNLLNSLA